MADERILPAGPAGPPTLAHPALAGIRVRVPGLDPVWLVDEQGYRRLVPNTATSNHLFKDDSNVRDDLAADVISLGNPLDDGAILVQDVGTGIIYLTDGGQLRAIDSEAAMQRYNFSRGAAYGVPPMAIKCSQIGPGWAT
jgi:hypothetical protein